MLNGELSILNDHHSTDHLLETQPSQQLRLHLQYKNLHIGFEKQVNAQFPSTTTIRAVVRDFLRRVNLESIPEEDVSLIEITHDKRYHIPVENAHMTLSELNIEDGCTLCFQPSLTVAPETASFLIICETNLAARTEFRWYERFTTLGMLLEYVIQNCALESIERERIHLFHNLEELDLASNYDTLLENLGIRRNDYIDVNIIPSKVNLDSFTSIRRSDGFLSLLNEKSDTGHSSHDESSPMIQLELNYMGHPWNRTETASHRFLPTAELRDVMKAFLKTADLQSLTPEDLNLVEISYAGQHRVIPVTYRYITLSELNITNGSTLYFESVTSSKSVMSLHLAMRLPDSRKSARYSWNKTTTTLGMLFRDIIELFSLQSIEHERICLTISMGKKLDYKLHADRLLSDLGVKEHTSIDIEIVPSQTVLTSSMNQNVHIECSYTDGKKSLDLPVTITIEELRKQIEKQFKDYNITDLKLFNRLYEAIDIGNSSRELSSFGIEPSQTVYAYLRLVYARNPLSRLNSGYNPITRSTPLIDKQQPDEVTVLYKLSTFGSFDIKASINDTVAELLKKLEILKKDRPRDAFDIWCNSVNIDTEQPNKHLSDFGIKTSDIIHVTVKQNVSKYALENGHPSTFSTFDNLSRTRQYSSLPVGLGNLGNTCYMNSALQCLAHTKPLTQFFLDGSTQDVFEDEKDFDTNWNQFFDVGVVTGSYVDVLRKLWLPTKRTSYSFNSCRPDNFREIIGLRAARFATWDQQDAQEFMTYLLDEIHKEFKEKNGSESSTIIEELFFGKLQSTVTCQECAHQVTTTNVISFLPLPLSQQGHIFIVTFIAKDGANEITTVTVPENGQVKHIIQAFIESRPTYTFYNTIIVMTDDGQLDLEKPLNQLSVPEVTLVEENDFFSRQNFDQLFQYSNKKTLTLEDCLKEFFSVESLEDSWLCQKETCKKQTKATKQFQLSSLPPILIVQLKRFSHENGLRRKIETFLEYPIENLDLNAFLLSPSEKAIYDLFAVSCHIGSIYGGHYIAYAQHESAGKTDWYQFDDSFTSSYVLRSDIVTKNAYLLFYIRRETTKQATSS